MDNELKLTGIQIGDPLEADLAGLSDEQLKEVFDAADRVQAYGFLLKCKAIWTFRQRHVQAWGKSWTNRAIERFGCSRPYAFAYANLWEVWLRSKPYLREGMASLTDSRSLMQAIGRTRTEDAVKLLEGAVSHIAEYGQPPTLAQLGALVEGKASRPRKFGPPLNFRGLRNEPIDEQGVVFLFGMIASEMGFLVESVRTPFPDCRAKRRDERGYYVEVNIELEFKSSNFREHGHDPAGCDLVVCWEHDWPGCPVEVIALKDAIRSLPAHPPE
jgi:hypothetical protein